MMVSRLWFLSRERSWHDVVSAGLRWLVHPIAWKGYSQKAMCRTVYRAPLLRRILPLRTPRTQNSNHYVSRIGIRTRSGQYAAPPQNADTGEG
jgi:hypothetical protein